jgi:multidrug efflux system membrane fusion protein
MTELESKVAGSTVGSKRLRWPAAIVALGLTILGGWLLYRAANAHPEVKSGPREQAIPVAVGLARRADVPINLDGLGTATAFNTVTVRSRVDGQLVRVAFREGQDVRAGDLLAEIDRRSFEVQLRQAEGSLARDAAQLDDAKLDLTRDQTLLAQELIPQQQLDAQVAMVGQLTGSIRVDQAAIDTARLQLTYCRITAPVSGRVGLRLVDAGNIVHAADPGGIVVLTQTRPMAVVFTLPEDDVQRVVAAVAGKTPLTVTAFDRSGTHALASGRLVTPDNQIDPTTGTLRLKAVFDNTHDELFPNQFVNVRMLLTTRLGRVVVPVTAIQRGQQGAFVFVVKPDKTVAQKSVTVGTAMGDDVEIADGLEQGDAVVTDGADRLKEGALVEPQDAAKTQAPSRQKHT